MITLADLEQKARQASAVITPAELHGLACGMAAGNPGKFSLSDFIQLAGEDALTDDHAVTDFVTQALRGFAGQDMEFSPLTGGDDEPLVVRLTGLSEWCAGFLSGFAAAITGVEVGESVELPTDIQEIIGDFASISGLDSEEELGDGADDDIQESYYMELFEYTRVAAVLALTLMSGDQPDDPADAEPWLDNVH